MTAQDMLSLEDARSLVTGRMRPMPVERVGVLEAVGRVCAREVRSDMDVSPFAHSAMEAQMRRRSSMGKPSSRMKAQDRYRGRAPEVATSFTVPHTAKRPMSPPGKKWNPGSTPASLWKSCTWCPLLYQLLANLEFFL